MIDDVQLHLGDKPIDLYIAIGYCTEYAKHLILHPKRQLRHLKVHLYTHKTINLPAFAPLAPSRVTKIEKFLYTDNGNSNSNNNGNNKINKKRLPLTVLAHKVPNSLSFPNKLGRILGSGQFLPPYKEVRLPNGEPVYGYMKNGLRHYVYTRPGLVRNKWYMHVQYRNNKGTLTPVHEFFSRSPFTLRTNSKRPTRKRTLGAGQ